MSPLETLLLYAGFGVLGILLGEFFDRVIKPLLPARVLRAGALVRWYYLYPFRWLMPDTIYKLWLRTEIMTVDAYRQYQECGFIRDKTDPALIAPEVVN